jgi:hypothetical protein
LDTNIVFKEITLRIGLRAPVTGASEKREIPKKEKRKKKGPADALRGLSGRLERD